MRVRRKEEVSFALALFLCLASPAGTRPIQHAPERANEVYEALDYLLPLSGGPLSPEVEWALSFRVRPAFRAEGLLEINKTWKGVLKAVVTLRQGSPLHERLEAIQDESQTPPMAVILERLAAERKIVELEPCGKLTRLAASLPEQKLPAVPSTEIVMDATIYEFRARTRSGEIRGEVQGAGSDPFFRWLKDAEHLLYEGCAGA